MRSLWFLLLSAIVLTGAVTIPPVQARSVGVHILSPSLALLGGRQLTLTIPPGWEIVTRDPLSQWQTSSYDLDLRWYGSSLHSGPSVRPAYLDVVMHDVVWARMHGDLSGTRFRTAGGLRGIEHEAKYSPGERDWYLTIPIKATQGALTVRLGGLTGSRRAQWRIAHPVFRSVRFFKVRRGGITSRRRSPQSSCRVTDPPISVPAIARLAGFRVGVDTIEAMERRLGHGQELMGGHPHGARSWWLWRGRWHLWADGFDYNDGGRVLDTLSLDEQSFDGPKATPMSERKPLVRVPHRSLGWMGIVFPGMTRPQVLRAVKDKLPMPRVKGGIWHWRQRGFVRVNTINHETFTEWTAAMSFERGRVSYIWIECE